MTTVLVAGGAGFIGSNFILHLLCNDPHIQVRNLDSLTYAGNKQNLLAVSKSPRYQFVLGSITYKSVVERCMAGVDAVINFAAESHVDRSIMNASPFVETNVLGTQVLLDAVRKLSIPRFIQVSTDEVYGSLGATGSFTEDFPLAPSSPYAASKAAADLLVLAAIRTHGVPAIITRCSNNFGPFQFPEKLIPLFINNLLQDLPVPLYGDGSQIRDWIYVEDHCKAIYAVLQHGRVGEIYHIGAHNEHTNLEIAHMLLKLLYKPESLIKHVEDRKGHDRRYALNCSKIEHELGWRAKISLQRGLVETVDWYSWNTDWLQAIRDGSYRL